MQLKDFWATLVRRWYLSLLALALAIGGTFFVVQKVGPTFEAEGSVLIFPPVTTVQRETQLQAQSNPYLVLNGVSQARDIVIRSLTSKSNIQELADSIQGASFEATPDFTNSAPIILITAEAGSAEDAKAALSAVMERVPNILVDLQSGLDLPSGAEITSRPLLADTSPDPVYSGQLRAALVAGVVTLALGLLLVGLMDGLLSGRIKKNRKGRRDGDRPRGDTGLGGESDVSARPQERSRRLGPRAPVQTKGGRMATTEARAATTGDRPDLMDPSVSRSLRGVPIGDDNWNGAAKAAKA